ncbi:MAG: Ycf66 family protein, partial [Leptolyngbyaceae cyanobacterium bins.59]|nr:Ycf66 family protein [Leptolyngbyaceae cyanobacterium bins.59]
MLPYALSVVVALGSFTFFMKGFFYPSLHRRNDFLWSGVGLFYGLILWVCAEQIRGVVLLGQSASVILLGWTTGQILTLRWHLLSGSQKSQMPDPTLIPVILQEPFKPLKGELPDGISPNPPVVRGSSLPDRPTTSPPEQPSEIMSENLNISVPDPSPDSSLSLPVSPTVSATRSNKKAQLNLSPNVLKEVAQSVQAGVQQVFRNVTGKKP